jgi:hypothetical protein
VDKARPQEIQMEELVIVDSSFSAVINAPLKSIDIPVRCFRLPDEEYQGCSPAHFARGSTTALHEICFPCHAPAKDRDYVFTH